MRVVISESKQAMALKAAAEGAERLRAAIKSQGEANIILAAGASQFEMLDQLVRAENIAWNRVTAFHLDEHVGLPISHPASFRLYLWRRFVSKLPLPLRMFHYIDAQTDPEGECHRLDAIIREHHIDVAFIGIGENGHLAFNDPPADFDTEKPYLLVSLDDACRRQQLGEGWFSNLANVPKQAVSMSIRQIMKSKAIVCTVPDHRKAGAVKHALEGPVTPLVPASILQEHGRATVHLDPPAAALLKKK